MAMLPRGFHPLKTAFNTIHFNSNRCQSHVPLLYLPPFTSPRVDLAQAQFSSLERQRFSPILISRTPCQGEFFLRKRSYSWQQLQPDIIQRCGVKTCTIDGVYKTSICAYCALGPITSGFSCNDDWKLSRNACFMLLMQIQTQNT